MSAELTTVLVALLGVLGTLLSPILAQQIASRAKRFEFDLQRQRQLDERRDSRQQQALDERRADIRRFQHSSTQVHASTPGLLVGHQVTPRDLDGGTTWRIRLVAYLADMHPIGPHGPRCNGRLDSAIRRSPACARSFQVVA